LPERGKIPFQTPQECVEDNTNREGQRTDESECPGYKGVLGRQVQRRGIE
jgi:hypothetical protein